MKQNTTRPQNPRGSKTKLQPITIGIDLGDRTSRYCALEGEQVARERSIATTRKSMRQEFGSMRRCRIALEVGAHSRWVSRLLEELGHEVYVANARQVRLIAESTRKDDRMDAQTLARLARVDPELLRPIRHRSDEAQLDLVAIRARAALVEARTKLVNSARGLVKGFGERLPSCDTDTLGMEHIQGLPPQLQGVLAPLLEQIETLTEHIQQYDEQIEQIARSKYPETELLEQVNGVGTLIALTFLLTLEDAARFQKSRDVGCYLGLRPQRRESGQRQAQLGISKEGDVYLRKLLVQGAHGILRHRAPDTDLKRWGRKLAARGGANAKKRAVVAVARKLAILLHRLWVTAEVYQPLRNHPPRPKKVRAKAA